MRPLAFTPPDLAIDANLGWVLRAAFAADIDATPPAELHRALEVARATQLSGRIASRRGSRGISAPVGPLEQGLSDDYYANVAKEALLTQAQERVAEQADRRGIPLVAVKFGGLRLAGVVSRGARTVSDLDILLSKTRARELWHALVDSGFLRTRTHEYSHQLEALVDPYGAVIDLHVHLPGVVVERGSFATLEQLVALDLVIRTPSSILRPTAAVLAAHAIAHAIVQNRATPQTYSPSRMLADLLDLRRVTPDVLQRAAFYLATELGQICSTLERLCELLESGRFDTAGFDGSLEQTLLRHCLAARLDADYSERLRRAGLANKLTDGSSSVEIARYVVELLFPSEAALDFLYGPAPGRWGKARRRLRRPIDLLVRSARRSLR